MNIPCLLLILVITLVLYNVLKNKKETFDNKISNILLTTYFCKKKDPQRKNFAPCDDIKYIKPWYESIKKLDLNGIVFHDGLSKKFVANYETENIKFVKVDSSKFKYSLNDQRYFIYLDYLKKNQNIKKVFMTDGNDVTVIQNPFEKLNLNKINVGSELSQIYKNKWIQEKIKQYNSNSKLKFNSNIQDIVYNAGILGGERNLVINFLQNMIIKFNNMNNLQIRQNLNTIVFNNVIYNDLKNNVNTGEPLHSRYKKFENNRKDICFIHK